LQDYPKCDAEVQALAREVWGARNVPDELTAHTFGKGRVIWGREIQKKPDPDFETTPAFRSAKWIWFNEGQPAKSAPPEKRFFRRLVIVDAASPIESARLSMIGDNSFECWVNGTRTGAGHQAKQSTMINMASCLKPGTNLIAVAVDNAFTSPNPAGLAGALTITYRDGRTQELRTDGTWEAAKTVPDNWTNTVATATGWSAALELGSLGMAPWGNIEEGTEPVDTTLDITVPCGVLAKMDVLPDFSCTTNGMPSTLRYIHKRIGDDDVYFVANPGPREVEAHCTFRVADKQPELWWPDTGRTQPAAVFELRGICTTVPLRLEPNGSVFVVFRKTTDGDQLVTAAKNWDEFKPLQEIAGPWEVQFPPNWGAPEKVTLEKLISWSDHRDQGVKYFSGTATYRKIFTFDQPLSAKSQVHLDLGKVAVMAEVKLNGKDLGILWKPPYRVDITKALKAGENALEIKVVNLWINRMIGDEQLPEDSDRNPNGTLKSWPAWLDEGKPSPTGRFTFTSWRLWKKDDALVESGLLGPVMLHMTQNIEAR
jgi:hypothetical protein